VLSVRHRDIPAAAPDSYYAFQLVGLAVEDDGGHAVGVVTAVHPGVANDNLELDDGRLVPLIEDAIGEIDVEGGTIVVAEAFLL
jgi:ribosomal 30S subunit maturation factor RimM